MAAVQGGPGARLGRAVAAMAAAGACLTACGGLGDHGAPVRDRVRDVASSGPERSYLMHTPPGGSRGRPVVLALHGLTGSGRGMERVTHLDQIADRYDFTVVYPDGPKVGWHAGTSTDRAAEEQFVARVITDVVRTGHANPQRIFVVGLSSGALFTHVLGCAMADQIAGIAAVSGPMPADASPACHPARALLVLLMHGTDDPVIPYHGGKSGPRAGGVEVLSVPATAARWRELDGCRGKPVTRPVPDRVKDGTHVTETSTDGCAGGVSVALYTVAGGGHAWPGGEHPLPGRIVGRTSRDFDASEIIWRFFAKAPHS